jgi:hypothetical protein
MNVDTEFLRKFADFLHGAFPAGLDAREAVSRADIMVYSLAAKLCSLTGTQISFNDWAAQGGSGGGVPHGVKPPPKKRRRLDRLVAYAEDVATPELAQAYVDSLPR